jgi:hypothetical protein
MDLRYKNHPSKYELYYIKWNGINFDKEKLIKFINRLKLTYFLSFIPSFRSEYKILKQILLSYDQTRIRGLLQNDETITRICLIEKWARIGAIDILTTNVFSRPTYIVISNFPTNDYQLIMKRIDEHIKKNKELSYQSDDISNDIPGL